MSDKIIHNMLAINADDFGPHPYINAGIYEAIKNDKIHSVGVFANNYKDANYDCEAEVTKLIAAIGDKNIGIGVHLTISSGEPITSSTDLYLEGGAFQAMSSFDFGKKEVHLKAIYDELFAQINRIKTILEAKNLKLDHISSHHGLVTLFTPYHKQVLKVIADLGLKTTVRSPLPISKFKPHKKYFKPSFMQKEGVERAKKMIDDNLPILGLLLSGVGWKKLQKKGFEYYQVNCVVPEYLFDYFYKRGDAEALNTIFKKFPKKKTKNLGEIIVHLGKSTGNTDQDTLILHGINAAYFPKRQKELDTLLAYDLDAASIFNGIPLKPLGEFF